MHRGISIKAKSFKAQLVMIFIKIASLLSFCKIILNLLNINLIMGKIPSNFNHGF